MPYWQQGLIFPRYNLKHLPSSPTASLVPKTFSRLFEDQRDEIEQAGIAEVNLAGRKFTIQRQFLEDLNAHAMTDKIGSLRRALIVFHAPFDNVVGIDNAARIFEAAKHPKSFVSLDDADHLLTRRPDLQYVADVLSTWAGRFLPDDLGDSNNEPSDRRLNIHVSTRKIVKTAKPRTVALTGLTRRSNCLARLMKLSARMMEIADRCPVHRTLQSEIIIHSERG